MNLLEERWIPVRRASGQRQYIAPHEIIDGIDNDPIVALAAPRPDFNGALMQFLIGLVQTAWVRAGQYWDRDGMILSPPSPQELASLFEPMKGAFEFDGDGPRFMQEFSLRPTGKDNELRDIRALLIEAPGDTTLKENRDHFVKRTAVEAICLRCSAAGLFTLQIHAPSGGRGHVPSLRKGGEITTLIKFTEADTGPRPALWRDVACNVLDVTLLKSMCDAAKVKSNYTFPWLAPLDSLQHAGGQTWPRDVHPSHMFWAMPRRIRLDFYAVRSGVCDICGEERQALISRYFTWPNGLNYNGESKEEKSKRKQPGANTRQKRTTFPNWQHPLSPYVKEAAKTIPASLDDGGLTYRHWLGWAIGSRRGGKEVLPAAAVQAFRSTRIAPGQTRLLAFGYDMDIMKARCWYETTFPLFDLPFGGDASAVSAEVIVGIVDPLITTAETAADMLRDAIRDARVTPSPSQKRDPRWREAARQSVAFAEASFWNRTEHEFFALVEQAIALCRKHGRAAFDESAPLRRGWLDTLRRAAMQLFDEIAASGSVEAGNPGKLGAAHSALRRQLFGPKLLVSIGLQSVDPDATSDTPRAAARKSARKTREAR